MAVCERVSVPVSLAGDCTDPDCLEMAWKLHRQLKDAYRWPASTMPLGDFDTYLAEHRTARKRAGRAERLGYRFADIDRPNYEDDVFAINTSAPERQGRPMTAGYQQRPTFSPIPMLCPRHHVYTYGVLDVRGQLAAYLWLYRSGDLAMVSSILGHADRLADNIMYMLATEAIRRQTELGGTLFYNMHSGGTDGLRYFKERLGLGPSQVEWLL